MSPFDSQIIKWSAKANGWDHERGWFGLVGKRSECKTFLFLFWSQKRKKLKLLITEDAGVHPTTVRGAHHFELHGISPHH